MGQLVFQATLGGQVNLVGPNTASTYNINVPTVNGTLVTTGDTGTVTSAMLSTSTLTASAATTASANKGAINYGTLGFSDTGIVQSAQTSVNSYFQNVMQNTSNGASASAEFIAYNDQGTATTNYATVGINSSGYSGTGSINAAGYGYFLTASTDLVLGTIGANAIHLTTNSAAADAITISSANVTSIVKDALVNGLTVGRGAGAVSTNTAVGASALAGNSTGSNNTAVGYQAGYTNVTGTDNYFAGYKAGYASMGTGNTFVGSNAGVAVNTYGSNAFFGYNSGNAVTTGYNNTIIGSYTGNNGGLDIRTANGYIVLSDGAGNARHVINGSGAHSFDLAGSSFGTSGQVLTSNGSGAVPTWTTVAGAVSSVNGFTGAVQSVITAGTAVASTSGTSINFTSIPSWVKRITVILNGVSTNGTSIPILQLGAGSVTTSGYLSNGTGVGAGVGTTQYTTGFAWTNGMAASDTHYGNLVIDLLGSNIWVFNGSVYRNSGNNGIGTGGITLGGTLDRVRITTVNGTDTFDAGSINILYE